MSAAPTPQRADKQFFMVLAKAYPEAKIGEAAGLYLAARRLRKAPDSVLEVSNDLVKSAPSFRWLIADGSLVVVLGSEPATFMEVPA